MYIARREAGTVGFDEESADALAGVGILAVFAFELGPDDGDVGNGTGRNPHLLPVEDELRAGAACTGSHPSRIGAEARFGQAEAAKLFSSRKSWKPGAFLFVRAEGIDGVHDQR